MDQALAKELSDFKRRAQGDSKSPKNTKFETVSGKNRKRKNNDRKGLNGNLLQLPPQILKSMKKGTHQEKKRNYYVNDKTRLALIASIVDYLRDMFLSGNPESLTLEEILDRTQNLDTNVDDQIWLKNESLIDNPRIKFSDGKFSYKPYFDIKDKKTLKKLLETYNDNGYGGILIEQIRESLPDADNAIISLKNRIFHTTRNYDKKDVLFYYDPQYILHLDDDMKKLWQCVPLDGVDEKSLERFLEMSGLQYFNVSSLRDKPEKKEVKKSKPKSLKIHNYHLPKGALRDYSDF